MRCAALTLYRARKRLSCRAFLGAVIDRLLRGVFGPDSPIEAALVASEASRVGFRRN